MLVRIVLLVTLVVAVVACGNEAQPPRLPDPASPLAARFEKYAPALEDFARSHNLHIDKYLHGGSQWAFCFEHPRGGQATLELKIDGVGAVTVEQSWWVDSYAQFTRSLRYGAKVKVEPDPTAVSQALGDALAEVVGWEQGEWSEVVDDYRSIWGQYSEAEFRAMAPKWPRPVL
jgi:hypothetical protein